ncbi:MAG: hypothetical protein GVY20_02910 [Bacteroidetes bacterium]|nr:hypothetical protein [Bacteroidota bacterium]
MSNESVSLTRLAWISGPLYSVGNLGYGWELIPQINGNSEIWQSESVLSPTANQPFWRLQSKSENLETDITDIIVRDQPVLLRKVIVTLSEYINDSDVRIFIPVYPDPRNSAPFESWNGEPAEQQRTSIEDQNLLQVDMNANAIILRGAPVHCGKRSLPQYRQMKTMRRCSHRELWLQL